MASASDDFAGTGALSGNWTNISGTASRVSGEAVASTADAMYMWNATTWTANVRTGLVVGTTVVSSIYVFARFDSAALSGYALRIIAAGNPTILRFDAGDDFVIGTITSSVSAGQLWELSVVGSTLQAWLNGSPIGSSATDTTYPSTDEIGFLLPSSTDSIRDWSAQDMPPALSAVPVGPNIGVRTVTFPRQ